MGNGETKEFICMTHGHELRGDNAGRREVVRWRRVKGREKRDKCNSITNKLYLKTLY